MLMERRFQLVFVRENHGAGITAESKPDKVVTYSGRQTSVTLYKAFQRKGCRYPVPVGPQ